MLHTLSVSFFVVAFSAAGAVNAVGAAGTRAGFACWGFPPWWGVLTGGLEVGSAVLAAFPGTRPFGLGLGAAIVAAALLTVLRHRDWSHLGPLGVLAALIAVAIGSV